MLNAIVAEAFCEAADILEKSDDFDKDVHELIKKYMTEHKRIVFNGNGYSDEWVAEAERRGLPNIKSMVDAASALTTDKSVALFEKFGIFTKAELESREEITYETYTKYINIEALTMISMASKQILPAVISYTTELASSIASVEAVGCDASVQKERLEKVTAGLKAMNTALEKLIADQAAGEKECPKCTAVYYHDTIMADMAALRAPADRLEMLVDKDFWPIPTYGDLLFEV